MGLDNWSYSTDLDEYDGLTGPLEKGNEIDILLFINYLERLYYDEMCCINMQLKLILTQLFKMLDFEQNQ